jgi:hypothetical protein
MFNMVYLVEYYDLISKTKKILYISNDISKLIYLSYKWLLSQNIIKVSSKELIDNTNIEIYNTSTQFNNFIDSLREKYSSDSQEWNIVIDKCDLII